MANCNHKYIIYATWICRGSLTASTWSHQIRIWRVWSWLCFENRSVRSIRVRNRTRFLFLLLFLFLFLFLYFWFGSARGCKWHLIFEQDRGCINWKRVETIRCARQIQKLTRPYGILLSSLAAAPPTRSLTLTFQPKVRPQSELSWAELDEQLIASSMGRLITSSLDNCKNASYGARARVVIVINL